MRSVIIGVRTCPLDPWRWLIARQSTSAMRAMQSRQRQRGGVTIGSRACPLVTRTINFAINFVAVVMHHYHGMRSHASPCQPSARRRPLRKAFSMVQACPRVSNARTQRRWPRHRHDRGSIGCYWLLLWLVLPIYLLLRVILNAFSSVFLPVSYKTDQNQ